jgi:hypothetical protein
MGERHEEKTVQTVQFAGQTRQVRCEEVDAS